MYYTFDAVRQLVYHFSSQTINFQEWTFSILFSRKNSFMLLAPWCILWFLCERQTFMPVIILWHRVLCQQYIDKIYAPFGAQGCLALLPCAFDLLKMHFQLYGKYYFQNKHSMMNVANPYIFVCIDFLIYQKNKNISFNWIMEQ